MHTVGLASVGFGFQQLKSKDVTLGLIQLQCFQLKEYIFEVVTVAYSIIFLSVHD